MLWTILWYILIAIILIAIILFTIVFVCPYIYDCSPTVKKSRGIITIEELKKVGKTGDLVLYSGNDTQLVSSELRKLVYKTEFTHAGILYMRGNEPYIWESCPVNSEPSNEEFPDILTGKIKNGPKLRKLEYSEKSYTGYLVHFPIYPSLETTHSKEEIERIFQELFQKYKDYSFDGTSIYMGVIGMFNAFDVSLSEETSEWLRDRLSKDNTISCIDLVTETYNTFGFWGCKGIKEKLQGQIFEPKIPLAMYFPHHLKWKGYLGNRKLGKGKEIYVDTKIV